MGTSYVILLLFNIFIDFHLYVGEFLKTLSLFSSNYVLDFINFLFFVLSTKLYYKQKYPFDIFLFIFITYTKTICKC